jgi:NADH-quinone oxidoreductase subunit E
MDAILKNTLETFRNIEGNTVLVLQEIQNHYQYLPEEVLEEVSQSHRIPLADLYSVATFYSQFKFNKPGKYQIKVCHGTACHINGAVSLSEEIEDQLKIGPGETTEDGLFSLENVACLGCCSLAPVIMVNEDVYGNLDDKKISGILKKYRSMS